MPALTFDDVTIKTGAGKVEIESITAKTLSFTFGAGEVAIGQLSVSVNANIETGAGKFTVVSGLVSNLDLDLGVGETLLKCDLLGESELKCGVGQVSLTLSKQEDYTLKLDKGLIDFIGDPTSEKLLIYTTQLAKSLGMHVTAEGVETESQVQFLKEICCDDIQGYYFSKPLPVAEFETIL